MKGKLVVLIIVCLTSMLGLISLVVPEPTAIKTTVTFATTPTVTGYRSSSYTLMSPPEIVTYTTYWTVVWCTIPFQYVGYCNKSVGVGIAYVPPYAYSTSVTRLVITSTVTSSFTQTGYITKQMAPISNGSAFQEGAVALVVVLAVSLLMAVLSLRKRKDATRQSKLDPWQSTTN